MSLGSRAPFRTFATSESSNVRRAMDLTISPTDLSSASSTGCASAIENDPLAVRRKLVICAPPPSAFPRSAPRDLIYVPGPQTTRALHTSGFSVGVRSNRSILTFLASRSISIPSRASSCNRRPSTFSAEDRSRGRCLYPRVLQQENSQENS